MKLLIEDRRTTHTDRFNINKHVAKLVDDDKVMAKTTIRNDTSTNKVATLSYQVQGPFRIVKYTDKEDVWLESCTNSTV